MQKQSVLISRYGTLRNASNSVSRPTTNYIWAVGTAGPSRASPPAGLVLLIYAVLVLLVGLACDPTFTITYENQTDRPIQIFLYGKFDLSLEPMETKTLDTIEFDEATFEARTLDGRVIFSETLTRAEMEARDWRIVIVDSLREKG